MHHNPQSAKDNDIIEYIKENADLVRNIIARERAEYNKIKQFGEAIENMHKSHMEKLK